MIASLAPNVRLECPVCKFVGDPKDMMLYLGCPECRAKNRAVNLQTHVPTEQIGVALRNALSSSESSGALGMWRWAETLPVAVSGAPPLGVGATPLVPLPMLATECGVPEVLGKNEGANPTWSHKDRLAAMAASAAVALGADTVTAASTGNQGAAVAALAARAGLRCVIFTLASVPSSMKTLMQAYGAEVVEVAESSERFALMQEGVRQHGWFPASNGTSPPVGSHPLAVAGYRTVAYELFDQLGRQLPDVVIVPVAYGDCLAGMATGFADLCRAGLTDRVPRLIAAERFGAISAGLSDGSLGPVSTEPTAAFSIGSAYATEQALLALMATDGLAQCVEEQAIMSAQLDLARTEGLYVEAASAAAVAALRDLAKAARVPPGQRLVLLLTSSGLKDPESTRTYLSGMAATTAEEM